MSSNLEVLHYVIFVIYLNFRGLFATCRYQKPRLHCELPVSPYNTDGPAKHCW